MFYYNAVENRHKYLKQAAYQPKSFIKYTMASLEESPSATLGLGVSVQPAKLASPVRLLGKELTKAFVFSAHKMFATFCASFPNTISHFKILAVS